ncbi:thyrotropin-releasing hormone receptor-like [Macrobrachium rosenbergii]|uniref:thyrotropin-releasing hormone receptor-like n=1 Tax=Macrobrachium rosenbergii TaxID=79674 RepID=UPI0034D638C4
MADSMGQSLSPPAPADADLVDEETSTAGTDSLLPFSIALFLTCTMALAANIFMIASIINSKTLRRKRSTHFTVSFLISSASTALSCLNIVGLSWIDSSEEEDEEISSFVWTVLFGLLWNFGISHYFTSCALALTRLMAMMWPLKYQKVMSSRIANVLIIFPWMFSGFICMPAFYGVLGKPDSKMFEFTPGYKRSEKVRAMAYMATSVGGPVVIACIAYVAMFIQATRSQSATDSHELGNNHHISQWQSGLTRALLANIIIHLGCNIPHAICHAVDSFNKNPVFKATIHVICSVQYILDPMMFFIVAQEYRKAGLELLNCVFRRGQRSVPTASESYGTSHRMKTSVLQNTCDL